MDIKERILLASMAAGHGRAFSPVQLQKMLFLIDTEIAEQEFNKRIFDFRPYDYGPFDKSVYWSVDSLEQEGLIEKLETGQKWNSVCLTLEGQRAGEEALEQLSENAKSYICRVSDFVLSLNFRQLVTAIYKAYPDMKANSVFNY